jgi:hypothetical protein
VAPESPNLEAKTPPELHPLPLSPSASGAMGYTTVEGRERECAPMLRPCKERRGPDGWHGEAWPVVLLVRHDGPRSGW